MALITLPPQHSLDKFIPAGEVWLKENVIGPHGCAAQVRIQQGDLECLARAQLQRIRVPLTTLVSVKHSL